MSNPTGRDREIANSFKTRDEALNWLSSRGYRLREALDITRARYTGKQPKTVDERKTDIREEIDRMELKIDKLKQELDTL